MSDSLRTPLGRVRGHGAAKAGTGHFISQRVSAIALAILAPWFVISAAVSLPFGYEAARAWVAQPLVAAPLALLVLVGFYHMRLGMAVVIEDYIHKPVAKTVLLLGNLFLSVALSVTAVFCILQISFGS
jgi:succinate dehydrogenase / fumarate reductase, membrane anchor subunit